MPRSGAGETGSVANQPWLENTFCLNQDRKRPPENSGGSGGIKGKAGEQTGERNEILENET